MPAAAPRSPDTMLVRIKPSNVREVHTAFGVSIRKSIGWHEVPTSTARSLAKERMNALNPGASPFVFDVKTKEEARETVAEEVIVADPAGTVDAPRVVEPTGGQEAPAASGKGGKKKKGTEADE